MSATIKKYNVVQVVQNSYAVNNRKKKKGNKKTKTKKKKKKRKRNTKQPRADR